MATIDEEKNVGYYDIIPYYSNSRGDMNYRWPGVLLDDVEYVYSGKVISLTAALFILSPTVETMDEAYLKKAM
ncbi:MAG: hypothetical protein Q9175_006209, partial [Cornicularia normoerica]